MKPIRRIPAWLVAIPVGAFLAGALIAGALMSQASRAGATGLGEAGADSGCAPAGSSEGTGCSNPAQSAGTPTAMSAPPTMLDRLDVSASKYVASPGETIEIVAKVRDDGGNPSPGVVCTFTITARPTRSTPTAALSDPAGLSPPSAALEFTDPSLASLDREEVTTDESGVATTNLFVGAIPGTIEILVGCDGFTRVLDIAVAPDALPATGAGGDGGSGRNALVVAFVALAAGLAGCASLGAALRSRARR